MTFVEFPNPALIEISTHTLTWSVTTFSHVRNLTEHNFNSHAHVERDKSKQERKENEKYFNSHAHVERDLGFFKDTGYRIDFNSHAHVERDAVSRNQ